MANTACSHFAVIVLNDALSRRAAHYLTKCTDCLHRGPDEE